MNVTRYEQGARFHAFTREVHTRINTTLTLYAGNVTRLFLRYRTQSEFIRHCFHALHMKNFTRLFLCCHKQRQFQERFHAITREATYGNSPDSSKTRMADSVGDNRPNLIITTRRPRKRAVACRQVVGELADSFGGNRPRFIITTIISIRAVTRSQIVGNWLLSLARRIISNR